MEKDFHYTGFVYVYKLYAVKNFIVGYANLLTKGISHYCTAFLLTVIDVGAGELVHFIV